MAKVIRIYLRSNLHLAISIITNIIFKDIDVLHGFAKQQFAKLLSVAVQNNFFMFNNKLFKQTYDVAIRNLLGPLFCQFLSWLFRTKVFDRA